MESSSFGRLIGVLVDPAKTFRAIRERPTWAVAFLVLLVLGATVGYLAVQKLDPAAQEATVREALEGRGLRGDELEDQVATISSFNEKIMPFTPLIGLFFSSLAYLLIAALLLSGTSLLDGELGFKRSLSVTLHSLMPQGLAALLAVPVVLGRDTIDPEAFQSGNLLPSNLAFLAPEDAHWAVEVLLGSVDFFSLWTLFLLVVGTRIVGGLSRNASILLVGSLWLLWIAVKLVLAAFGNLG